MEFHIRLVDQVPDLDIIEDAIGAIDPAVVLDLDAAGSTLRVAAAIDAAQLVALITGAGYPLSADQVSQVPSICCGGCSG